MGRRPRLEVVSGGQTGVDRAALDAARDLSLRRGGWCPRGRRAEDGRVPASYPLRETPTRRYAQRTDWNVRDSDATLVLRRGRARGGTALTARLARRYGRPLLQVDLGRGKAHALRRALVAWLSDRPVRVLNVAGPRESECPGIYAEARRFLRAALRAAGRAGTAPASPASRAPRRISAGTASPRAHPEREEASTSGLSPGPPRARPRPAQASRRTTPITR